MMSNGRDAIDALVEDLNTRTWKDLCDTFVGPRQHILTVGSMVGQLLEQLHPSDQQIILASMVAELHVAMEGLPSKLDELIGRPTTNEDRKRLFIGQYDIAVREARQALEKFRQLQEHKTSADPRLFASEPKTVQ